MDNSGHLSGKFDRQMGGICPFLHKTAVFDRFLTVESAIK